MSRRTDERLALDLPQHAYAQSAHAGCVFEVRARTFADGSGSYVHVVVHAPANAPHEQSAEYLTEDATAAGALRSGITIAKSMIMDRVQWGPGQLSRDGHASGPS